MAKGALELVVISVFFFLFTLQADAYLTPTSRVFVRRHQVAHPPTHVNVKAPDADEDAAAATWNPLGLSLDTSSSGNSGSRGATTSRDIAVSCLLLAVPLFFVFGGEAAWAALGPSAAALKTQAMFDPSNFQPVCPASDGVYNVLKAVAGTLVGSENVVEYGPLIASVLLRIRLELCVLESFLYEAVIPFIQKKGLSWVLPFHETVETFLAGTIFAVGTNFILLGSTKILSILFIYADVITGMPSRFVGAQVEKSQGGAAKNAGKVLKAYGDVLGGVRSFLEAGDTFVGRYLVILTTGYIAFKLAHFKLFNDIIPF